MFVQLCDFFSAVSKFRLFAADASIKLTAFCCASVMAGCTTSGQVTNQPILNVTSTKIASGTLFEAAQTLDPEGLTVILAFSGGGIRASALSYGILEELRDTTVELNGQSVRLLDEVDFISAVCGGSLPLPITDFSGSKFLSILSKRF